MKALRRLRELFPPNTVNYIRDEDDEDEPYYTFHFEGDVPGYNREASDAEKVRNRKALGDAMLLKLVDFLGGNRSDSEFVVLMDSSRARAGTGDLRRYDFEFQVDAERMHEDRTMRTLGKRTVEQASLFSNDETLGKWMEIQGKRNAAADRIVFPPSDEFGVDL